jgi:phage N-6-adenine-methyltransferase
MTEAIALSDDERNDLAGCEAVIRRGLDVFLEVGAALLEIQRANLFRATHDTFDDYLEGKWPAISRASAYRYMKAAEVDKALSPIGDTPRPANEAQFRELARVAPTQRDQAWQEAVIAQGGKPAPARVVEEVVAAWKYQCQACQAKLARWFGKCPECEAWNTIAEVATAPADDGGLMAHAMPELLDEPAGDRLEDGTPIVRRNDPALVGSLLPRRPAPVEVAAKVVRDGDEWYTPAHIIEAARRVLGGIDLDPASCEAANKIVGAREYYSPEKGVDGLSEPWRARAVLLNPPYSDTSAWVERLVAEYRAGNVAEAIVIVNAKTETAFFELLWEHAAICFVRGRIAFVPGDGGESTAGRCGSAIAYLGNPTMAGVFKDVFSEFGRVVPQGVAVTATKEAVA